MVRLSTILGSCAVIAAFILQSGCESTPSTPPANPAEAESAKLFQGPVRSVIEHRCIHCHHDDAPNGGLNFQDRELVFQGDIKGPFLVPGNPDQSRIWDAIFPPMTHPKVMPGDGWGLNQKEYAAFLKWIETGAYWPEGKEGKLKVRSYQVELEDYL